MAKFPILIISFAHHEQGLVGAAMETGVGGDIAKQPLRRYLNWGLGRCFGNRAAQVFARLTGDWAALAAGKCDGQYANE